MTKRFLALIPWALLGCVGDISVVATSGPSWMGGDNDVPPTDVSVADASATDVSATDVSVTDVSVTDVSVTDVSTTDVSATDVSVTDVSVTDVSVTDVSVTDVAARDAVTTADSGTDSGMVLAMDAARDVPIDLGTADTGMDVPRDAGAVDTGVDVPRDVAMIDTGVDVPRDVAAMDTGVDVPRDVAAMDTGVDVPRDTALTDTGVDVPRDVVMVDRGTFPPVADDTVAYTGSFPARTGRFSAALTIGPDRRTVDLYVPAGGGAGLPLVVMFHGTNGSGAQIMTDESAQAVANANNFVVAAPSSRWLDHGDWDHATAETYWETYPNVNPATNPDLLLVRAILVEAQRAYGIDPNRVYSFGHSSGGFFSLLVSTVLQDRIAAFVENSAGMVRCATTSSCSFRGAGTTCAALATAGAWCNCTGTPKPNTLPTTGRWPAGYLVHGNNDPQVSIYYSCTLLAQMNALGWEAEMHVRPGDGHDIQPTLLADAWPFLSAHVRP